MPRRILSALILLATSLAGRADTFHVTAAGADDAKRDGKSPEQAWASLAFACEQVPAGMHTIRIGAGNFTATRQAVPKNGVTIQGSGSTGENATRLVASKEWKLRAAIGAEDDEGKNQDEYLIAFRRGQDITVKSLELASDPAHPITGAFYCRDGKNITLEDLVVHDFRWNGFRIEFSQNVTVANCVLTDCSSIKRGGTEGGHIRTRWISESRLHHNRILSTTGRGYGYKGSGHVNVRIDHNFIDVGYFAIESAHEGEYGVEIDHNYLTRCISVPKGGQSQHPSQKNCTFTFWIHDNLLTDSYTIEGPRNHMRISHNYIRIEKEGGRVYTHHGGTNHGPVWIDHNIIENVDRAVVWMNQGLAENIYLVNNTITCADAGDRTDAICGAYSAERLSNWVVKNNVILAPESKPRKLFPTAREVPTKIVAEGNLLVNVSEGPKGNFIGEKPGFLKKGDNPWAIYQPADAKSFVVDRGLVLEKPFWGPELPFEGKAPDIGAVEFGEKLREWDVPMGTPLTRPKK